MTPTNNPCLEALEDYKKRTVQREAAHLALTSAENALDEASRASEVAEQVRVFFTLLAEDQRRQLEGRVQSLVDYGVQAVFGSQYRFRLKSDLRGKSVRTEFFLVEIAGDGTELELPLLDATGGGVGDVVAFLLRVVMLCLIRPAQRRVLILDEPFKFVSTQHFEALEGLIREMTQALGLQLICVTHRPELLSAATTIVRVKKVDGTSTAEIEQVA